MAADGTGKAGGDMTDQQAEVPALRSLAFRVIPRPDWAEVTCVAAPPGMSDDPRAWAEAVFDTASMPRWLKALFGARQAAVGLIGIRRARTGVFDVSEAEGGEALIVARERHLDFACGVAYGSNPPLVRVTTAVTLHGWRGRAYFMPVTLLHGPITRAMVESAIGRMREWSPT